ncbi:MAG: ADP-ribosylglycohydrolase family protein [Opitutales bacterium]|nr:ADP-ribosylglycohydrolase family protein [Opitutales bacterium]
MLGAIAGDIIGSVHEFSRNSDASFPLFVERSCPTDDSLLTWAVAESILRGERDYKPRLVGMLGYYEKHGHDAPLPAAFGGGFSSWVYGGARGERESFGNGSAMRVSPVAWAFDDLEKVLEHATLSARPSHNHPEGIKGAQAVAAAIWTARMYRKPEAVRAVAENFYGPLPDLEVIRKTHAYNETCQGCVPECLAIAVGTPDFETAVRFAASIRGDADTLAAITGSVSQALWGVPRAIREQSLAIAARCYPGLERTVAEFEARFGGY